MAVPTTAATEERRMFMPGPRLAIRLGIEPEPPVGQGRLRPQERVLDPVHLARLQAEALDLRPLVAVEDLVVAAVREHEPQARLRALGQAAALRRLREPEV